MAIGAALFHSLVYLGLFGPVGLVLFVIASYLNDQSQEELRFVRERLTLQYALREAELKNLQDQIRPHFLFNTFNVLRNLVLLGQRDEALELLQALTGSLRYAVEQNQGLVSLHAELQAVRAYLRIQEMRFRGRLKATVEVEPEVLAVRIPYMSVQPLVENACSHGIEPRVSGGQIVLRARREAEHAVIEVRDDGVGMPSPLQVRFGTAAPDPPEAATPGRFPGVGLSNVHRRLQLHYGGRAELHFESVPGSGTTVMMRIPLETDRQGEGDRE